MKIFYSKIFCHFSSFNWQNGSLSCVRGYHRYKNIWDAVVGEELQYERETGNESDSYTVAVKKDRVIVGHLLRKILRTCSLF